MLQLLTTVNCAFSISRIYINVNYTTRNSCPTKEGQWIVMFVLQKYFSAVYKGNNKITELRTILQRESQNS